MNKVFNDSQVQQQLNEIEKQRKIRRTWQIGIYIGITTLLFIGALIFNK